MRTETDIVAVSEDAAPEDTVPGDTVPGEIARKDSGPEDLDADVLDHVSAATAYGGTNTCEPPRRNGRLDGLFIKSWGHSGSSDEPGGFSSR